MLKYLSNNPLRTHCSPANQDCNLTTIKWKIILVLYLTSSNFLFSQEIRFLTPKSFSFSENLECDTFYPLLSFEGKFFYFTQYNLNKKPDFSLRRSSKVNGTHWHQPEDIIIAGKNGWSVIGIKYTGDTIYLLDQNAKKQKYIYSTPLQSLYDNSIDTKVLKRFYQLSTKDLHSSHVHSSGEIITLSGKLDDSSGGNDLYVVIQDSLGKWLPPVNLGKTINSSGDEITPFLTEDTSRLFFSSDGHSGLGDMDIFYSERLYGTWNVWSYPVNLSDSVNSEAFDAFFTMNRQNKASFVSTRDNDYQRLYLTQMASTTTASSLPMASNDTSLVMESIPEPLLEEDITYLLGSPEVPVILFEEGSSEIRPNYREILYYIANKIREEKYVNISLVGHADQTGSKVENFFLSEDRAYEVQKYFESYGINSERITKIGMGEQQPLFTGESEEEQGLNRRVEIILSNRIIPTYK